VELVQCETNYKLHYHDGEVVTLTSDRAQLAREVEKWEGEGGSERLDGFLAYADLYIN
jgi:phytoene desaturase (3,4-didehydrolycopene-forming)